jgi:hypothetical protein
MNEEDEFEGMDRDDLIEYIGELRKTLRNLLSGIRTMKT